MITPSFGLTATERVLPKLALDFTTASLDPRITFTRSGNTATVTNANGSVTTVNADLPRFDYANGVCRGLLIEESRTNSAVNSILNGAVTGSPGTPPTSWINSTTTGSISAIETAAYASGYKLTFSCSNARRSIYQQIASAANTSYTLSATVEIVSGTIAVWNLLLATLLPAGATLSGYTVDGVSQVGSYNVPLGTHVITLTVTTSTTTGSPAYAIGVGLQAFSTAVVKFSNVQVEQGSFATSYIPTTTTALTRNADVATMTGTNFSDWYSASQGTFRVDALTPASGTRTIISADDNTAANSLVIAAVGTAPKFVVTQSSTEQANVSAGTIIANTAMFAYASYGANYFGIARPSARQVDTSGTVPTVDRLRIGVDQAGNYANGIIQAIQFWP